MGIVSINGVILEESRAAIPVMDHGFLYGDSIYETMRTYGRKTFLFDEHLRRLRHSARYLTLSLSFSDEDLHRLVEEAVKQVGDHRGELLIRMVVTRGVEDFGYGEDHFGKPNLVIIVKPLPAIPPQDYEQGITLVTVSVRRNAREALNPSAKTGNLLNPRLAFLEARRKGAHDGIMLNLSGKIAECTSSNIFFVTKGALRTPSVESGILGGTTRDFVLTLAREAGIPVHEETLDPSIIADCDECFITSTTRAIMPVREIDGRMIGTHGPGAVTKDLQHRFSEKVRNLYPVATL
ncbi:MAG: aminotransferase class IV family protein [Armatimonadetes bacterium]|nr:aminotransferase class IV family protein [Armatimonadota bacterium]